MYWEMTEMKILGMGWPELIIIMVVLLVIVVLATRSGKKQQAANNVSGQDSMSASDLQQLHALMEQGVISPEEFAQQKKKFI